MKISILLIATKKYKQFVQPLIDSLEKYFLISHDLDIHLFTDEIGEYKIYNTWFIQLHQHLIPSYGFPEATLYRYEVFTSLFPDIYGDYIFYLDVDMGIVDYIGDEILGHIVAVRHPGYYKGGWGSKKNHPDSRSYISPEKWNKYYAGGFQGGINIDYYSAMKQMAYWIRADKVNDIIAEWHDENHWNYFLSKKEDITELDPSYCMPEAQWKRELWNITEFKPKILALEKEEGVRE